MDYYRVDVEVHGVANLVCELRLAALLHVLDGRVKPLRVVIDLTNDVAVPLLAS